MPKSILSKTTLLPRQLLPCLPALLKLIPLVRPLLLQRLLLPHRCLLLTIRSARPPLRQHRPLLQLIRLVRHRQSRLQQRLRQLPQLMLIPSAKAECTIQVASFTAVVLTDDGDVVSLPPFVASPRFGAFA
jgi:hypothetical protein